MQVSRRLNYMMACCKQRGLLASRRASEQKATSQGPESLHTPLPTTSTLQTAAVHELLQNVSLSKPMTVDGTPDSSAKTGLTL